MICILLFTSKASFVDEMVDIYIIAGRYHFVNKTQTFRIFYKNQFHTNLTNLTVLLTKY